MFLCRLAALGCCLIVLIFPSTLLAANEYFWPAHHEAVEFKVKAHAIRGTLKLSLGAEVTIADKIYRELIVETKPAGLPKQSRVVFLRADEQGLYSRYSTSPDDKEVVDLALPVSVGKTWQTHDRDGTPSERVIQSVGDCQIRDAKFKGCVKVSFKAEAGAALAVFAPEFGEIIHSRANGFSRRSLLKK